MIRITSKKDGFRRCGVAHAKTPTDYPDDRFSKAELKTLSAEPLLTVEILEDEAKKGGKTANQGAGKKAAGETAAEPSTKE